MGLPLNQEEFRGNFAESFLKFSLNPDASIAELRSSFAAIESEFKRRWPKSVPMLKRLGKPKGEKDGVGSLLICGDVCSFTTYGISKYKTYIDDARRRCATIISFNA